MEKFISFIFSSFWIFLGFVILAAIAISLIETVFDFIVELIHGKAPTQNFYNKEESKKDLSLEDNRSKDGKEERRKKSSIYI